MSEAAPGLEAATLSRVTRRLIPFLFVLYIANYLDRVNVSFAALQMNRDLGFSAGAYGLGAGMFFLGYCVFQVPSNLVLARVGARRWIGAIMIVWGAIASAMMLVRGVASFYALRFLLGVVEAGFFPGMIFYLANWFPAAHRARAVARFMTAIPLSGVVGGPLSGWLLGWNGVAGLAGWQWLFVLEGLPSAVLGVVALRYLTDRPEDAAWLPADGRVWLAERLRLERAGGSDRRRASLRLALLDGVVWRLGVLYFLIVVGLYGQGLWLPQLIKGSSQLGDLTVGLLAAAPALAAAVAMVAIAAHSDRTGERHAHVAVPLVAGAIGFAATALALDSPLVATGRSVARRHRVHGRPRAVLGPPHVVPERSGRGRRHRPHQLTRQHRGLRRALPRGCRKGRDRRLRRRAARVCGSDARRGVARALARARAAHDSSAVARRRGGRRTVVVCSYAYASLISVPSLHGRPTNDSPTGSPRT